VELTADDEVPIAISDASGELLLTIDSVAGTIDYTLTYVALGRETLRRRTFHRTEKCGRRHCSLALPTSQSGACRAVRDSHLPGGAFRYGIGNIDRRQHHSQRAGGRDGFVGRCA
jgi:hypothetical protein